MSTTLSPILLEVKVIPQSKFTAILIDKSGTLCFRITSAAERGKANQAIIQLVAQTLRIPQAQVTIVGGLIHRRKRIQIVSLFTNQEELINKLAPPTQLRLY